MIGGNWEESLRVMLNKVNLEQNLYCTLKPTRLRVMLNKVNLEQTYR